MFGFQIGFNSPLYLLLLLVIPLFWMLSYHSLSGLGSTRRLISLSLRSLLLAMIVMALAEVQLERMNERLTVIYLLDQSASIPAAKRSAMLNYVVEDALAHRNRAHGDRAGVVVFGKEALIEFPPMEEDIPAAGVLDTARQVHSDATDLAAAMGLAQTLFAEDTAKRIVIVTDGNENLGDARAMAPTLAEKGIGINIVPIDLDSHGEIAVDKVILPSDIRENQSLEARVSVVNLSEQDVEATLRVIRRAGDDDELLKEQDVVLAPGKQVFRIPHFVSSPDVYTYRAVVTPKDPAHDLMVQNNEATAFTHVRGRGRVLLIENWAERGSYDYLAQRLRASDIEVRVRGSDDPFQSLAELQAYDAVILGDVPRSSAAADGSDVKNFSDDQIRMLVRAVEQMGIGVIMMGGPNSFGAGGWTNTDLEKAMPVDFQIKNEKVRPVGALVLMMHACELPQGNYWEKVVAQEAIKALGPGDYCGLSYWDNNTGKSGWLWNSPLGLQAVGGSRNAMLARLSRMSPGDMPDFEGAMKMSLAGFNSVRRAAVKHMIIISDGDPSPPSRGTMLGYQAAKIQISTVAIGTHGQPGNTLLQQIATDTGGKYYVVRNPQALPRIYQNEARKVSRPLVYEPEGGVTPQVVRGHEMHGFLDAGQQLPNVAGFVLTTLKDSQLVEVSIRSPKPADAANSSILASWQYGRGRTVAFTSDAGHRWASSWTDWESYDRFFEQMVRWAMRPIDEDAEFTVDNEIKDGRVTTVIRALDKQSSEFISDLQMSATVTAPDMSTFEAPIVQVAPGTYQAVFDADQSGDYLLSINPGDKVDEDGKTRSRGVVTAGVTVPYSAEFRDRETNVALLKALAGVRPQGGQPGHMLPFNVSRTVTVDESGKEVESPHSFQHNLQRAVSIQDVWPLFVLAASLVFFADIFVRRVTVSWEWTQPIRQWVRKRWTGDEAAGEQVSSRLEQLRSRKEAVGEELDERRRATRFEPSPDVDLNLQDAVDQGSSRPAQRDNPAAKPSPGPDAKEDEDYTSRLLKAKNEAFKRKEQ
ncbi:MAG: VWA domain-containing protein [Planctomycetales bacterium]|nr:VWA domain-containing protein [Planctomycetales bacterium]